MGYTIEHWDEEDNRYVADPGRVILIRHEFSKSPKTESVKKVFL